MKSLLAVIICMFVYITPFAQNVSIANDKMNVAYIGNTNPITIVVEGYKSNLVHASTDNGSLVDKGNGKYDFTPLKAGKALIMISIKTANGTKEIGTKLYRIKDIPKPIAYISPTDEQRRKDGGLVDYKIGLAAKSSNEDFSIHFVIVSFTASAFGKKGLLGTITNLGPHFNPEFMSLMMKMNLGDKLVFSDIQCKYPDGSIRKLDDLVLTNPN